ncbi:hypothetical protein GLAREA_09526 [Glarea lozoyensis ATCC 20868]|uniref:Uncharacterized protein n=1 Tax=Glarea lozoyensis (strain ATCC 20868 / MF5171) TaxID=1116229 RepID=S3D8T1_GLAL2|nr:uncharacterized protein GLAREA_09526 [Glarea lozoyensis ATCC 20868]EPE28406.1 hypothetical protein GLAREA_09526 [Glarea lozoyensis ATCC 20868]
MPPAGNSNETVIAEMCAVVGNAIDIRKELSLKEILDGILREDYPQHYEFINTIRSVVADSPVPLGPCGNHLVNAVTSRDISATIKTWDEYARDPTLFLRTLGEYQRTVLSVKTTESLMESYEAKQNWVISRRGRNEETPVGATTKYKGPSASPLRSIQ